MATRKRIAAISKAKESSWLVAIEFGKARRVGGRSKAYIATARVLLEPRKGGRRVTFLDPHGVLKMRA